MVFVLVPLDSNRERPLHTHTLTHTLSLSPTHTHTHSKPNALLDFVCGWDLFRYVENR